MPVENDSNGSKKVLFVGAPKPVSKLVTERVLVMAFEEEFGCEIPDDAAEKILTIKDATGFIESTQ